MFGVSRPIFQFQLGRFPVVVDISAPLLWLIAGSGLTASFVPPGTSALDPASLGALLVVGLLLSTSVLVHELGHAMVGERFGARVDHIALHGMGGYCASSDRGMSPGRRLLVSLAGPGFGLAFGLFFLAIRMVLGDVPQAFAAALGVLIFVNLFWSAFNLLPMPPLDGGAALRHLLATRLPAHRAAQISAWIGLGCAVLLGLWGLSSGQTFLFVMCVFSFLQALAVVRR